MSGLCFCLQKTCLDQILPVWFVPGLYSSPVFCLERRLHFAASITLKMLRCQHFDAVSIAMSLNICRSRGLYYLWYVNMINKTYCSDKTFQRPILSVVCYVQHDQWVCFEQTYLATVTQKTTLWFWEA